MSIEKMFRPDRFYSISEIASMTGYCRKTVQNWYYTGINIQKKVICLPMKKMPNHLKCEGKEIIRFLNARKLVENEE